jgi:hypothetical protein
MDFTTIIIMAVVASVVLPLFGWLVWWLFVFFVVRAAFRNAARALDQALPEIERLIASASEAQHVHPGQAVVGGAQILTMLMSAHTQMAQMDHLSRQMYETRIEGLAGQASSLGLDVNLS